LESLSELDGAVWTRTDRTQVDPNFQVNSDGYLLIAALACITADWEATPRLVELGSTFGAAITKWSVVSRIIHDRNAPVRYVGIDNASLMARMTALLHGPDVPVLADALDLPSARDSVLLSRFVASYVFRDSNALLNWITSHFDALAIEDPFSTSGLDWNGQNHGQRESFFSLPLLVDGLLAAGYAVGVIDSYGDWPAGTAPCHVVKLIALRDTATWESISSRFYRAAGRRLSRVWSGRELLDDLNASVTPEMWDQIRSAKEDSPVWGPTSEDYAALSSRDERRAEQSLGVWQNYRLAGPDAVAAIAQALTERPNDAQI